MNNKYCFRYIKMILIFVALFAFKTNVKASDKYVCFYGNPDLTLNSNYVVKLTYENEKTKYEFYNAQKKETMEVLPHNAIDLSIFEDTKIIPAPTSSDFNYNCPGVIHFKRDGDDGEKLYLGISKESTYYDSEGWSGVLKNDPSIEGQIIPKAPSTNPSDPSTPNVDVIKKCHYSYVKPSEREYNYDLTIEYNSKEITSVFCDKRVCIDNKVNLIAKYDQVINSKKECAITLYYDVDSQELNITKGSGTIIKFQKLGYDTPENAKKKEETTKLDTCESIDSLKKYISMAYNLIRFIIPVLIVVLSSVEFAGIVLNGATDNMEKAKKHFIIRLVIGVAIVLIPVILEMLLRIAGIINGDLSDVVCYIIK